jgi:membrane fusion protein (multidrug efflux system)
MDNQTPALPSSVASTADPVPVELAAASHGGSKGQGRSWVRRATILLAVVAAVLASAYFLYPRAKLALTTVSTDDAYVNSHVTYVAPRITENVVQVRVDNNDFVKKGDLLLSLDDTMWAIRVKQAVAALDVAKKTGEQALAKARATIAEAKANRFKLASAISEVKNNVAGLRLAVARLREAQAAERLAKAEAQRYATLAQNGSVTQEQADIRRTEAEQAHARVRQAEEDVHRARAVLELPEEPPPGKSLDDVPPGLEQRHSSVLAALGVLSVSLAEVGLPLPPYYETPDEFIAAVRKSAPNGDIDALIDQTVKSAPGVETAQAQIRQAEQALAQARLELGYCVVRADIEGFVSNRNVNVGDRVVQGQKLMAVRSFEEVWVDANFKETQLEPIRIGQPADLYLDAYPGKVFHGRVSGFSPGTGASTALFPPQNATGNFVKIIQRLPVRIDLVGGNPPDTPLFIGLSVEPYVKVYERPAGPNAGQRLRGEFPRVATQPVPSGLVRPAEGKSTP